MPQAATHPTLTEIVFRETLARTHADDSFKKWTQAQKDSAAMFAREYLCTLESHGLLRHQSQFDSLDEAIKVTFDQPL